MDRRPERTTRDLADEAVSSLRQEFRGRILEPEDPAYDSGREVWNGMIDKHPALIARCTTVDDVVAAVRFAREKDVLLAVRGGGHNVAGTAVCNGGLVIDLSEMHEVQVDAVERTVRVQGGATWADVDSETQKVELATPGGVVSDTGVAGLTLSGGIGHLRRKYGLTCDNLRAVEIVTADGKQLTASPTKHSDLFWALKGGGGNFGVGTAFEFDCYPLGPEVAMSLVFYPGETLPDVLRQFRLYAQSAPAEVSTLIFAGELPDEELFEAPVVHEQKFAIMACYAGPADDGKGALAPLRSFAEPIADFSDTMSYTELQQLLDEEYPTGMRYYWKSLYLDRLSDDAVDRIVHWTHCAPSALTTVDIWHLGGAIADVSPEESAFAARQAPFLLGIEANWEDPHQDDANVAWARECFEDMKAFSDGREYLNFPGFLEGGEHTLHKAFGDNYTRLEQVKAAYDPENLFQVNQNIEPNPP